MNGPQHFREAERHLEWAHLAGDDNPAVEQSHLQYAQVHATLALVAAQALSTSSVTSKRGWDEWSPITDPASSPSRDGEPS